MLVVVEVISIVGGCVVVMIYWNLVLCYGVDVFVWDLVVVGGFGLIIFDFIFDEV